ncbi:MAG: hypothetical protein R2734_13215 [Nocardioides sp.]
MTRREQSIAIGSATAATLARRADSHVFGPTGPRPDQADTFWSDVLAERRTMSASVSRARRLRAAVSLTSFGSGRSRRARRRAIAVAEAATTSDVEGRPGPD